MASELAKSVLAIATAIQSDSDLIRRPPKSGGTSETDEVLDRTIVADTRRYIEQVTEQINGCFEDGWYDACSVMIRRLVETLIIEMFERHHVESLIKGANGDFYFLGDLIEKTLACPAWNLSRNTKKALPRLKNVGDISAHNRRYLARRSDIERIMTDLREVAEELVHLGF